MNPKSDGLPAIHMSQVPDGADDSPAITVPAAFHAPDGALPHYTSPQQQPGVDMQPIVASAIQPGATPLPASQQSQTATLPYDPAAAAQAGLPAANIDQSAMQSDEGTPLDEEWVLKAEEVIARTHADPRMQSDMISKLKAQYIKTRYNKDVRVSED